MECDPESTLVTIQFFPKSNSVHYNALTMELRENLWSGSIYIKLSNKVLKKITVILNVTTFCAQTMPDLVTSNFVVQLLYLCVLTKGGQKQKSKIFHCLI